MKFTHKINKAIMVASRAHIGQERKTDNTPYISHPTAVAMILSEYTDNEDVIIAALLHDVLEDVKSHIYSKEQMVNDFGENIVKIVEEVSEDKDPDEEIGESKNWKERKQKYLDDLETDSEEAVMVCAADKIHNLMSLKVSYDEIGDKMWENFNAPKEDKKWFYSEVVKICKEKLDNDIVQKLEEVFAASPLVTKKGEDSEKSNIETIINKMEVTPEDEAIFDEMAKETVESLNTNFNKKLILSKPKERETKDNFKKRFISQLRARGIKFNKEKDS